MKRNNKNLAVIIAVILAISSMVLVGTGNAQTIPTPSVPQFSIKYVDNSYDVPPNYGIDTYTGKSVIVQAGYHVQNKSLEVTIQNERFTAYRDSNGTWVTLSYDVRYKGHFGTQWQDFSATHVEASNSRNTLLHSSNCSLVWFVGCDSS